MNKIIGNQIYTKIETTKRKEKEIKPTRKIFHRKVKEKANDNIKTIFNEELEELKKFDATEPETKRIKFEEEKQDPTYEDDNISSSELGNCIELWCSINIKCVVCKEFSLNAFVNINVPVVDLICTNIKHKKEQGVKFYQVKTRDIESKEFNGLKYFLLSNDTSYIHVGSPTYGYYIHNIKQHETAKYDMLLGYICITYIREGKSIYLCNDQSCIIIPNVIKQEQEQHISSPMRKSKESTQILNESFYNYVKMSDLIGIEHMKIEPHEHIFITPKKQEIKQELNIPFDEHTKNEIIKSKYITYNTSICTTYKLFDFIKSELEQISYDIIKKKIKDIDNIEKIGNEKEKEKIKTEDIIEKKEIKPIENIEKKYIEINEEDLRKIENMFDIGDIPTEIKNNYKPLPLPSKIAGGYKYKYKKYKEKYSKLKDILKLKTLK